MTDLDTASCINSYRDRCLEAYSPIVQEINQEHARVLKEAAADCIAKINQFTPACDRPSGIVVEAICQHWVSGEEAIGESCVFPLCADGNGACNNGQCEPLGNEGADCFYTTCQQGLICLSNVCTALAGEQDSCANGEACAVGLRCIGGQCIPPAQQGANCSSTEGCAEGLACTAGKCEPPNTTPCTVDSCGALNACASARTCIEKFGNGADCTSSDFCAEGYYCDDTSHKCTSLPLTNDPCVQGVLCNVGLACTTDNGVCAPLPTTGEPCAFTQFGPFACADGLGCNEGTCGPLPGENEPCASGNQCSPDDINNDGVGNDLGCDFTANGSFCVIKKPEGGACQADYVCQDGLFCDFSTGSCAPYYPTGTACNDGNECGPQGSCVQQNGGGFACEPMPGLGDTCLFDCTEGLVCSGDPQTSFCLRNICNEL